MGRKLVLSVLGALALPLLAAPAMAQGKGVNCMSSQYSPEQREEIAELGANMAVGAEINQAVFDRLGTIGMTAIESCARRNSWSQEQMMYATFYELGRLNEINYRASGTLSTEQLRVLDTALAQGNRDRLWQVIEASVFSGMSGDSPISNSDAMIMGTFIISTGLDDGTGDALVAEQVGLLLGFMGLQRIGRREFNALN